MTNKLYKTLKDYVRCETKGEEEKAISEGYKDIREILDPHTGRELDITPVPAFKNPDVTKTELHIESEDTSFQGETVEDLKHRFINVFPKKRPLKGGKPTKDFRNYLSRHGKEWQQQMT